MSGLYARIARGYLLRGWSDCPVALLERQYGEKLLRCDGYGYVLRSCDGSCDFSSPAFLPSHRKQLQELIGEGLVELCSQGDPLDDIQAFRYTPCPVLKEINWAITDACNLRCVHCFMSSPERRESVSRETAERILGEIRKANVPFVTLTGGEPLLSPHFQLIVSELSKAGVRIPHISTNGVLLTEEMLAFLSDNGQRPDLLISFDGVGVHDEIRGLHGLGELVLENAGMAIRKGFAVVMVTTLMEQNLHALQPTYERLKSLSPSGWFINRAQSSGLYRNEKRLSTREAAEAILPVYRTWLQDEKPFPMVAEKFLPGKAAKPITPESPECSGTGCGAFLLPDGTLVPCQSFVGTEVQQGMPNILKAGLTEAWSGPELKPFRSALKKDRLQSNPKCASCVHFSECGMGCRAYALTESGRMTSPDPDLCELYCQGWRAAFDEGNISTPL